MNGKRVSGVKWIFIAWRSQSQSPQSQSHQNRPTREASVPSPGNAKWGCGLPLIGCQRSVEQLSQAPADRCLPRSKQPLSACLQGPVCAGRAQFRWHNGCASKEFEKHKVDYVSQVQASFEKELCSCLILATKSDYLYINIYLRYAGKQYSIHSFQKLKVASTLEAGL